MKKLFLAVFFSLFPMLVFADDSLSFAPPASDYSVVFLGNIFGIVDGVLHGTGSQIMGSMFAVFNAAVLAIGGMLIMYTLLVSTMNTAHEGEMLGKQWSSMWIPIRSTFGLALMIPKASGYCLMQIFVMWITVQGVGAADKVWDAALDYLNRGGVIIQAQANPTQNLLSSGASGIANGAQIMLAGQVCMLGLQTQLENQRQIYLAQKGANPPSGPCVNPSDMMKPFCENPVPNFTNTINFVETQRSTPTQTSWTVPMPNFNQNSIGTAAYTDFNGICGTISWNKFPQDQLNTVQNNINTITQSDLDTASMSRVIAIQQMFLDLSTVAQSMVSNNPWLHQRLQPGQSSATLFSPVATQQFGVPHVALGTICANSNTPNCVIWGPSTGSTGGVLLNGNEFQNAMLDYAGIMKPTLTLVKQAQQQANAGKSRQFITDATNSGWIMAGSYFFNLVNLNAQANSLGDLADSNTGLERSTFDVTQLTKAFSGSNSCTGSHRYLCTWLNQDTNKITPIAELINDYDSNTGTIPMPKLDSPHNSIDYQASSTVYGYTANSTILQLPGQPGTQPLRFADRMQITIDTEVYELPSASFPCGDLEILFFSTCLGAMLGDVLYNYIIRYIWNFLLELFQTFINEVLQVFLLIPLQGMAAIFDNGLQIISQPGVNPIVALANMGTYYINFVGNLWIELIEFGIVSILEPIVGLFIFVVLGLTLPLLLAWLGVMSAVGFMTAYYVPMLPYMIFTFGTIAWLMAVIESMVAAPIVALGITHPEGHEAFGKGEHSIMILLNVFLRPAMMIIGYIAAIALSYVSVWIINAGFDNAIAFIQGSKEYGTQGIEGWFYTSFISTPTAGNISGGYSGWAGVYAYFFSILIYTTMYVTVVTKAFTLIAVLPDKVMRWIGGQQESFSTDTAQWGEEAKGKVEKAGEKTELGQAQVAEQLGAEATKGVASAREKWKKGKGGGIGAGGGGGGGGGGPPSTPTPPPAAG